MNFDPDHWFIAGGLAESIFYIMLSATFVTPLFYIFDPWYLIRLVKRSKTDMIEKLSQEEANLIFEGPQLDLAQRYAN